MIHVDGKNVEEAARSSSVDGVASVVGVRPGVGPGGQAPVGKEVEHLFVRILLTERQKDPFNTKGCVISQSYAKYLVV